MFLVNRDKLAAQCVVVLANTAAEIVRVRKNIPDHVRDVAARERLLQARASDAINLGERAGIILAAAKDTEAVMSIDLGYGDYMLLFHSRYSKTPEPEKKKGGGK